MKNKIGKGLAVICITIVSIQLTTFAFNKIQDLTNEYVELRIRLAINRERDYIYADLAKLHPSRIGHTRRGLLYVTEKQ